MEILEIKEDIGAEPREKGICVFHQQRRSYKEHGLENGVYSDGAKSPRRFYNVSTDDFPCVL